MKTVCILLLLIALTAVQCRRKTIDLKSSSKKCGVGEHSTKWYNFDHWWFNNGCMKNSKYCADFALHTCTKCSWFSKKMNENFVGSGNWCALTWWIWLIACVSGILIIGIVVTAFVTCLKCCCSKQSEYDRLHLSLIHISEPTRPY